MIEQLCIESYKRLKNLKLVGLELGIPWQTVYTHLRRSGVPVTGDKARYGCAKDRLATAAENLFAEDVPYAVDANANQFQAAIDFTVLGWAVDVKAACLIGPDDVAQRWGFCINKQKDKADFFVLYAFNNSTERVVEHVFLLPNEIATTKSIISIPGTMNSKWADYEVSRPELSEFFSALQLKQAA